MAGYIGRKNIIYERSRPGHHPSERYAYHSYMEMLEQGEERYIDHDYDEEDIWLVQYTREEYSAELYRYGSFPEFEAKRSLPRDPVSKEDYKHITSSEEMRQILQRRDRDISHQIVILGLSKHEIPSDKAIDFLGIGLDMSPDVWDYMQGHARGEDFYHVQRRYFPVPWSKDCPVLRIGDNSICILHAIPGVRPKTSILFLAKHRKQIPYERFERGGESLRTRPVPHKTNGLYMFPPRTPSQFSQNPIETSNFPAVAEDRDIWLIRKYLLRNNDAPATYGRENTLFLGLAALVELHLSTPSRNIPLFTRVQEYFFLKYYGCYLSPGWWNLTVELRFLWPRLRTEVDEQRITLQWMSRFARRYFDFNEDGMEEAFQDLKDRFELNFRELELAESRVQDQIAMNSSRKSTEMAEQSIKESKRVMLLTALAFVFIPVSLASSIYGMNVRELNDTGPSIAAFVVTALLMCAGGVGFWVGTAAFQSAVQRSKDKLCLKVPDEWSFMDFVAARGLLEALRWKWGDLRYGYQYEA